MFLGRFPVTEAETQIAPYHVVWRVYPQLDLVVMSGILSGLAALEKRDQISLSIEFMGSPVKDPDAVIELVATDRRTGEIRNIVIDSYDRADRIAASAWKFADVYFKRAFGPETPVCASHARKIVPAGLSFGCYSREALRHVCIAILASLRKESRRTRGVMRDLLRHAYEGARLWLTFPTPQDPMLRDDDVKDLNIVFQPRLWPTTPGSGDQFDVVNQDRIAIVRALREAFPNERAIGLVHSETAAAMAPELQLSEHTRSDKYHEQLRRARIAVNCVGLSGSVGFKFCEYLAAGNAVVSQPITHRFLAPITEGEHYVAYRSPEECVDLCRRLMADDALSSRMRDVNRQYFLDWVNPPAHLSHLLTRAFAV